MLEKTKSFVKDHQTEIVIAGCVVAGIVTGVLLRKQIDKKGVELAKRFNGKDVIAWPSGEKNFINLMGVKEILDANANNSEMFAIFREGPNPEDYICISLSENVVI